MAKTLPQTPDSTDLSSIGPLHDSLLSHLAAEMKEGLDAAAGLALAVAPSHANPGRSRSLMISSNRR